MTNGSCHSCTALSCNLWVNNKKPMHIYNATVIGITALFLAPFSETSVFQTSSFDNLSNAYKWCLAGILHYSAIHMQTFWHILIAALLSVCMPVSSALVVWWNIFVLFCNSPFLLYGLFYSVSILSLIKEQLANCSGRIPQLSTHFFLKKYCFYCRF